MISLKRSTLGFVVLVTLVVGAGLGTWGAGAVDQIKPSGTGVPLSLVIGAAQHPVAVSASTPKTWLDFIRPPKGQPP